MIMVGCGTGVAPFRGFLQERADLKAAGVPVGESLLFFGFRHPERITCTGTSWRASRSSGSSRSRPSPRGSPGQPKTYVQDRIRRQQAEVWRLIEDGAVIFVCGNASTMAPAVRRALMQVCQDQAGRTPAEAEAWLAGLRAEHRYLEDVWGGSTAPAAPVPS